MDDGLAKGFSMAGKVAVVTGAASGIGRETALTLAKAGARVALLDVNAAGLEETARLVAERGEPPIVRRVDVSRRDEVDAAADAVLAGFGRIDAWANVAGIIADQPILDVQENVVDRLIAVNQKGVLWGCAAAARGMVQCGATSGAIVNLASAAIEMPVSGLSIYAMTKAAVSVLTRTAATEFGSHGIRVNAIAPGYIETPMATAAFTNPDGSINHDRREVVIAEFAAGSPLGITGTAQDVALCALYLLSDASRFVTGQTIRVNGGAAMAL